MDDAKNKIDTLIKETGAIAELSYTYYSAMKAMGASDEVALSGMESFIWAVLAGGHSSNGGGIN
jgi:hypothetical protein